MRVACFAIVCAAFCVGCGDPMVRVRLDKVEQQIGQIQATDARQDVSLNPLIEWRILEHNEKHARDAKALGGSVATPGKWVGQQ